MQVLSGAIGRERLHFEAPPRDQLERQLEAFLHWIASPPAQLDGLLRAGLAHLWFLTLHPYADGNGRLARAITDRLLAQDCRAQAQQELAVRRAWASPPRSCASGRATTTALERCQRGDLDVTGWLSWFLEQLTAAAAAHGAVIDAVQRKAAFWWSHRHSGFNSRQQNLLNQVAGCRTGGFHRRHDPAQGHQPHQGEPCHGLARSGRTGGAPGDRADRRRPQPRLSHPLARRAATRGWRVSGEPLQGAGAQELEGADPGRGSHGSRSGDPGP
jgi:hypothetical protein